MVTGPTLAVVDAGPRGWGRARHRGRRCRRPRSTAPPPPPLAPDVGAERWPSPPSLGGAVRVSSAGGRLRAGDAGPVRRTGADRRLVGRRAHQDARRRLDHRPPVRFLVGDQHLRTVDGRGRVRRRARAAASWSRRRRSTTSASPPTSSPTQRPVRRRLDLQPRLGDGASRPFPSRWQLDGDQHATTVRHDAAPADQGDEPGDAPPDADDTADRPRRTTIHQPARQQPGDRRDDHEPAGHEPAGHGSDRPRIHRRRTRRRRTRRRRPHARPAGDAAGHGCRGPPIRRPPDPTRRPRRRRPRRPRRWCCRRPRRRPRPPPPRRRSTSSSTSTTSTTLPLSNVLDVFARRPRFQRLRRSDRRVPARGRARGLGVGDGPRRDERRARRAGAARRRAAAPAPAGHQLDPGGAARADDGADDRRAAVALTVDATVDPPTVGGVELLEEEVPASNGRVLVVGGLVAPAAD